MMLNFRTAALAALLWLAALPGVAATVRLEIVLDFNDCINCTSGLLALHRLPPHVAVTVTTDERNRALAPSFLAERGIAADKLRLRTQRTVEGGSRYTLLVNGQRVLRGPLNELHEQARTIEAIAAVCAPTATVALQRPLPLSTRASFFQGGNTLVATDYVTGKCFVLDLAGGAPLRWTEIAADASFIAELRDTLGIDAAMHAYLQPLLRQLGKGGLRFHAADVADDCVHLSFSACFPLVEENGDTALADIHFVGRLEDGRLVDRRVVDPNVYDEVDGHAFSIEDAFHASTDSTFIVPLFKEEDDGKPAYLLTTMHADGGRLADGTFLPAVRPAFYDSMGYAFNFGTVGMGHGFAFLRSYPLLVSLDDGSAIDLRAPLEAFFHVHYAYRIFPFHLLDVREAGPGVLSMILAHNGVPHAVFIDGTSKVILDLPLHRLKADAHSLRFTNDGRVVALSAKHDAVLSAPAPEK